MSAIVVMGVAGAGKSQIGRALAGRLAWPFADADEFHSRANIEKMRSGTPLTDADRGPWLDDVGRWIARRSRGPQGSVVACSALRRSYRDRLRQARSGTVFVHLDASESLVRARLADRTGHFMPPTLLHSQFETLERLGDDEDGFTLDASRDASWIVDQILMQIAGDRRA